MKKIIAALALTAAMASPVFARTIADQEFAHHNRMAQGYNYSRDFDGPTYVGQDPDPSVQAQLRRDPPNDR